MKRLEDLLARGTWGIEGEGFLGSLLQRAPATLKLHVLTVINRAG